jgi:hypothetical protein
MFANVYKIGIHIMYMVSLPHKKKTYYRQPKLFL